MAPRPASLTAHARPMPREAPVTRATLPVNGGIGRDLPAGAEEAEEVAAFAEPTGHHAPVAEHVRGEREHLARAEVEPANRSLGIWMHRVTVSQDAKVSQPDRPLRR